VLLSLDPHDRHVVDHVGEVGFLDVSELTRDAIASAWLSVLTGADSSALFVGEALDVAIEIDSSMAPWLGDLDPSVAVVEPSALRADPWVPGRSRDIARLESASERLDAVVRKLADLSETQREREEAVERLSELLRDREAQLLSARDGARQRHNMLQEVNLTDRSADTTDLDAALQDQHQLTDDIDRVRTALSQLDQIAQHVGSASEAFRAREAIGADASVWMTRGEWAELQQQWASARRQVDELVSAGRESSSGLSSLPQIVTRPDPIAQGFADELTEIKLCWEVLDDPEAVRRRVAGAHERLALAERELQRLEARGNLMRLSSQERTDLERAHEATLEAEDAVRSIRGRGAARERLDEARQHERALLDQHGLGSFLDLVIGSLSVSQPADTAELEATRNRVAMAKRDVENCEASLDQERVALAERARVLDGKIVRRYVRQLDERALGDLIIAPPIDVELVQTISRVRDEQQMSLTRLQRRLTEIDATVRAVVVVRDQLAQERSQARAKAIRVMAEASTMETSAARLDAEVAQLSGELGALRKELESTSVLVRDLSERQLRMSDELAGKRALLSSIPQRVNETAIAHAQCWIGSLDRLLEQHEQSTSPFGHLPVVLVDVFRDVDEMVTWAVLDRLVEHPGQCQLLLVGVDPVVNTWRIAHASAHS
jgi:hypothetical protein